MKNKKWFPLAFSLFVLLLSLVLVLPTFAAEQVTLRGKFRGAGNDFSGLALPLGRFDGVFDPATNTAVWTTANGDVLTNQTTSFELLEEVKPGVYTYVQALEFTGGSGRYENASGQATVTGLFNIVTGAYSGIFKGTLTLPNS